MIIKKRYKPFYKQFLRLRVNIQNRPKLFKFKKQKWEKFQRYSKSQLKFFKRYKLKDQFRSFASKFVSRGNSFSQNYKKNLQEKKLFSLFYGGLKRKYLKKSLLSCINSKKKVSLYTKHNVIKLFESRLDTVLYRSGFSLSIKEARQLILHQHVLINKNVVTKSSYLLKENDLIEIAYNKKSRNLVKKSVRKFNFWPIPAKHLLVNYKTLQILFLYSNSMNIVPIFNHYLNINSVLNSIKKY